MSRIIDRKWEEIFKDFNVVNKISNRGYFKITSKEIGKYKEARLMAKFDHKNNLPIIFKKNDISILPISRGKYILGRFNIYQDINFDYKKIKKTKIEFPNWIESINPKNLYSEDSVLKTAFLTGMLKDLINSKEIKSTVGGRMTTGIFNYKIKDTLKNKYNNIKVKKSQIQIDGGYESANEFMLIEAKNSLSNSFLIRQLYYPYRLWKEKLNKKIIPVFLMYSKDIFSFFVYDFKDYKNYNSLELIAQKNYIIKDENINLKEVKKIYNNLKIIKEPKIPFPQADNFARVLDLINALYNKKSLNVDKITTRYDFNERQSHYYTRACMYLNLIKINDNKEFILTNKGEEIVSKNKKERNLKLIKSILEHKIFNEVFKIYLIEKKAPNKNKIKEIMLKYKNYLYNINSLSTINRRSQTVYKWLEWILDIIENDY